MGCLGISWQERIREPKSGIILPIMENQMETNLENKMEVLGLFKEEYRDITFKNGESHGKENGK